MKKESFTNMTENYAKCLSPLITACLSSLITASENNISIFFVHIFQYAVLVIIIVIIQCVCIGLWVAMKDKVSHNPHPFHYESISVPTKLYSRPK